MKTTSLLRTNKGFLHKLLKQYTLGCWGVIIIKTTEAHQKLIVKGLSRVSTFKGINEDFLYQIAAAGSIQQIRRGGLIFAEGQEAGEAFIILHGQVKISRQTAGSEESVLKIAYPGEVFGEMSLLDSMPRSASAFANEDSLLFSIKQANFKDLLLNAPHVGVKLLSSISVKSRPANDLPVAGSEQPAGNAAQASPDAGPESSDAEYIFTAKKTCPLCRQRVTYTRVKSKYIQLEKMDSDMCGYYHLINPIYYHVTVCSRCGYAFSSDDRLVLGDDKIALIKSKIASAKNHDFSGLRTIDQAIHTYQLAITCQSLAGVKNSVIGQLYLRLGCLYRHKKMPKDELECLGKALGYLEHAFENESFKKTATELNIIYLIGDLNNRMGKASRAVSWFNMVVNHPAKNEYPYIARQARERWQEIRLKSRK